MDNYNARAMYHNNSISLAQNYLHPSVGKQFYMITKALDEAERVEVKFRKTPRYNSHFGRVFIPLGEIATTRIYPGSINKVGVTFNEYISNIWNLKDDSPKFRQRLDNPTIDNIRLQIRFTCSMVNRSQ